MAEWLLVLAAVAAAWRDRPGARRVRARRAERRATRRHRAARWP
jgi:hypothetical protein